MILSCSSGYVGRCSCLDIDSVVSRDPIYAEEGTRQLRCKRLWAHGAQDLLVRVQQEAIRLLQSLGRYDYSGIYIVHLFEVSRQTSSTTHGDVDSTKSRNEREVSVPS